MGYKDIVPYTGSVKIPNVRAKVDCKETVRQCKERKYGPNRNADYVSGW